MAQGAIKKGPANPKAFKRPTGPTHGNRVCKPKKNAAIQQSKIKHKAAAGLTGKTEQALGTKAGHLELLRGGKNTKKGEVKKA